MYVSLFVVSLLFFCCSLVLELQEVSLFDFEATVAELQLQ